MSDNPSEGSYQNEQTGQKVKADKFRHTKNGPGSITGDFKFELGRKTQTFHSDVEENYSGSGSMPPALPPIFKKQGKKGGPNVQLPVVGGQQIMQMTSSQFGGSHASNLTTFNATKKNFPQLNKLTTHKKSHISPYSIKSIPKGQAQASP